MRILLIQPANYLGPIGFYLAAMTEPLALECLAATVADHEVALLDMRVESDLEGVLARFAPEVVAVTALTTEVYAAQEVLGIVKAYAEEIFTVVGGHHATLIPEDFYLPYVDAICLGEGELVFRRLIEALCSGRMLGRIPNLVWRDHDGEFAHNGRTAPTLDMNALSLPRRDLVERHRQKYFFLFDKPDTSVATIRGCPYRCSFCSVWKFHDGRTSQMSVERVMKELYTVDTEHVTFVDDNFMMNHRREFAIAERIKSDGIARRYSMQCRTDSIARHPDLVEKWVDVGLYAVLLGLEGCSDQMLNSVNKKNNVRVNDEAVQILQANGVIIWGAFLVDPDWNAEDFEALRDYVTRKQITHTQFTVLTPLPGTQLYREKQHELLTHDYTCYDTLHAVLPTRLPRDEFYRRFADLYRQPDLGPLYDLVREGKLSVEDCRSGNEIMKTLSQSEFYLENDPVLGKRGKREAYT